MRVAHRDDHDTHAVIGGKGVQEFGIAQTAEFFTVLSNTLYSNKPLAVIREVLCNAWDAHIVAGKTDTPVIITIDEDKLSIRDHGHGIPHDLIHAIYCVYGNSTKENDGNQTGGFGLGSKSPFAYSDHFTVNNHHAGLKTVHAISRGSALTQGKPDRRVMVSVPTMETGVEVVIPVKNRQDMQQFIEIAKDVAAFGEMNVLINGKQVDVVPISKAENNMFLTTRSPRGSGYVKINLRYGNVVYPVQPDAEYIGVYQRLTKILEDIPNRNRYGNGNDFHLIIQAPPNSISVTPSRESLSNTETTINTIKKLFSDLIEFMQTGNDIFEQKLLDEQQKAAYYLINKGMMERLYFSENLLTDPEGPKTINDGSSVWTQITNMVELADYYLRYKEKLSDKIKWKLEQQRVDILLKSGARHAHKLKRYRRMSKTGYAGIEFKQQIMRPLLRHVAKHEVLSHKALYVVQPSHRVQRFGWSDYGKYTPDNRNFLKHLQGVVIVTHNKLAYEEDWNHLTKLQKLVPHDQERVVYVAPRTKGHKEAAVELFTKLGYYVIDYATILDEYRAENYTPSEKLVQLPVTHTPRPRNQGLVLLSHNLSAKHKNFEMTKHLTEGAPRSTSYEYVIKPTDLSSKHGYSKKFFPWGNDLASEIALLFGSKIGICINDPQLESQKKKGKKDGLMFIAQQIAEKVMNSHGIRAYVENQKGLARRHSNFDTVLEMAEHSTALHKAFGLSKVVHPEDDLIYYRIFEIMSNRMGHYVKSRPADGDWQQPIWDAYQVVKTWTAAQAYTDLNELVQNSEGLKFLDLYDMLYALRNMSKTNPDYRKKVFIETAIINALSF